MPTLEEAIRCYEEEAKKCDNRVNEIILGAERCKQDKEKYTQLAAWLRELVYRRKAPEIVRCGECRHRDPEDKKCDCGHDIIWQLPRDDDWYCADAERRTDGTD